MLDWIATNAGWFLIVDAGIVLAIIGLRKWLTARKAKVDES